MAPVISTHCLKLVSTSMLLLLLMLVNLQLGVIKPISEIDWFDVFGEGGSALASLIWMGFILFSRPSGKVTDLLWAGLVCIFLSLCQDFLDEFIGNPTPWHWHGWIESFFMPIGIAFLTLGLYHWHQEQKAISRQLEKREKYFRQYEDIDHLTRLSQEKYIQAILSRLKNQEIEHCLIMMDVNNFNRINREFDYKEGDSLLTLITDALLIGIRRQDILCRYAGDRFAIILTNTGLEQGHVIAKELISMIAHTCFRHSTTGEKISISMSYGIANSINHNVNDDDTLVHYANQNLATSS